MRACIGLNWLRTRSCAEVCEYVSESRGSVKVKEFLKKLLYYQFLMKSAQ